MARSSASLPTVHRFVAAVERAGGTVPPPIQALLNAADRIATPRPVQDLVSQVIDELVSGETDDARLEALLEKGAKQQGIDAFRGDAARRAESVLIQRLHVKFETGCADTLLDSLRGKFDKAAEQIALAHSLIPAEAPLEQFLATATPKAIKAWQELPASIATVDQIAGLAAAFGWRQTNALFPMLVPYSLGDGTALDDRALWATDGNPVADSAQFARPDRGGRESPWFRIAPLLRLHTLESARERVRAWSEIEWEAMNSGSRPLVLNAEGQYRELPRQANPYKQKASV